MPSRDVKLHLDYTILWSYCPGEHKQLVVNTTGLVEGEDWRPTGRTYREERAQLQQNDSSTCSQDPHWSPEEQIVMKSSPTVGIQSRCGASSAFWENICERGTPAVVRLMAEGR